MKKAKENRSPDGMNLDWRETSSSAGFTEYWLVLVKYRYLILGTVLLVLLVNGIRVYSQKSVYHAESAIEVKPDQQNLGYTALTFINTQMKVATSREVADKVVDRVGQETALQWIGRNPSQNPKKVYTKAELAQPLLSKISPNQLEETFILTIRAEATKPEHAAALANTWAETLIDYNRDTEIKSSEVTEEALEKQVKRLQKSIVEKEGKLAQMADTAQVQVLDQQLNVVAQRVERLNQEVMQAQNDLVDKQAKLHQIQGTSPEALSEVQGAVQGLKSACNQAEQEYVEKSKVFKPDYPGMQQIKVKRDQACESYRREVNSVYRRVLEQARADLNATSAKQSALKSQYNTARPELKDSKTADYLLLKGEIENERKLLEQLSQQKQTEQLTTQSGGMQLTSLMRIVDYATPPRASIRPRRLQSMALALLMGLIAGTGLALALNFMDTKVHSHEDIARNTSLRFLTIIPEMEKEIDEQMNRNAFRFLNKFVSAQKFKDGHPRILLVTSAEPGEGKSFVASNLAISTALEGKQVILFDMDVHRPTVHRAFDISRKPGMGDLLSSSSNPNFDKYPRVHKCLSVVPGGDGMTQHLVSGLESPRVDEILQAAAREYDCVILDTGPMLVTPETLTIAQKVDGVILVVRTNQTPIRILRMTEEVFRKTKIRVLGVVLNRVSLTDKASYYHYNNPYRHYYTYYNLPIAREK